jgi:hypothetical protein
MTLILVFLAFLAFLTNYRCCPLESSAWRDTAGLNLAVPKNTRNS